MHRILFVDDEPLLLNSLEMLFDDYEVFTATSPTDALMLMQNTPGIKLIISDQRMPKMTGVELLQTIREKYPNVVRILLTGYADIDSVIRSVNAGAVFRYISKPWNSEKLRATVATAITMYDSRVKTGDKIFVERRGTGRDKEKVLIVDSNPQHLSAFQSLLQEDYDTLIAATAKEGFQILKQSRVAVVVSEMNLVDLSGAEFLTLAHYQFPNLVSVLHSDSKDSKLAIQLINDARIFKYLLKPLSKSEFKTTIRDAVAQHLTYMQHPDTNHEASDVAKLISQVRSIEADSLRRAINERGSY
jgi:DNA-binding NtrC family response regulator